MTDAEKIAMVQAIVDDSEATDALVAVYLKDAEAAMLRRRYPFGVPDGAMITDEMLQVKLAARYYLRRGGDGEKSHNENGINRAYGSVNDEDLLMEIVPLAKVL